MISLFKLHELIIPCFRHECLTNILLLNFENSVRYHHTIRFLDVQLYILFKFLLNNLSAFLLANLKRKEGKGATQEKKESVETETVGKDKKKKATGDKDATQEMKKSSETEASEKDKELSVSLLNIQVGLIRKAWKHPSADRYAILPSSTRSFLLKP